MVIKDGDYDGARYQGKILFTSHDFLSMINETFSDAFVMHDNDTFRRLFTTVCNVHVSYLLNGKLNANEFQFLATRS